MGEPFDSGTAKAHIRRITRTANATTFGTHAKLEMAKDGLSAVDVVNVLRCGAVNLGEHDGRHWRYTVETDRICVVVLFRGEAGTPNEVRIVTAWRKRR